MAYTFLTATGTSNRSNIVFSSNKTFPAQNATLLVTGWFYLRGLATSNTLHWFAGGNNWARAATTTANILWSWNSTPNAMTMTSQSVLSTGDWLFIAMLVAPNGYDIGAHQTCLGTTQSPPREVTMSSTGTGNNTGFGSTSTAYVLSGGNTTLNLGFVGEMAGVTYFWCDETSQNTIHDPGTTLTTAHKTRIMNTYLMPLWRGNYAEVFHPSRRHGQPADGVDGFLFHAPLDGSLRCVGLEGGEYNGFGDATTFSTAGFVPAPSTARSNPRPSPRDLYPQILTRGQRRMR